MINDVVILEDPHKTVPLDKFHEELWFEFQNCPTQLFDYYLLRTAREMASKGPLVRRKLKVQLRPLVTRYHVDVPDDLDLNGILDIRHVETGNIECGSKKVKRFLNPPEHLDCFTHGAWYEPKEHVLTIHLPNCGGYCLVVMSALPSRTACALPVEFYDTYLTALLMGTKAQILLITGRPWTNLRLGGELYATYREAIAEYGVKELRNKQHGIVRMRSGPVM